MKYKSSSPSRPSISLVRLWVVGTVCLTVSGCFVWTSYQREIFASDDVRVVHSAQQCNDADRSTATEFPNADLVKTADYGLGRLVATNTAWEVMARQLAVEFDADIALVKPCDGKRGALDPFEYAQIEVWRTRGFKPVVREEYRPDSGALIAPPQSTYGTRLEDIFGCLEQPGATSDPISPDNQNRLGHVDATEFFSSGRHFPGYARVDKHLRPTRRGDIRLSMIKKDRGRAAQAASLYEKLLPDEKQRFAERYLICLLDRGYSLWPAESPDRALQQMPNAGATEPPRFSGRQFRLSQAAMADRRIHAGYVG